MAEDGRLDSIRRRVARRRFRDLVERARRLSDVPPEETLKRGCELIESAHSLQVRTS